MCAQTWVLKSSLLHARGLRLTGHDQTRGILHRGFEGLSGKKDQRRFHDGKNQSQERDGDKCELNRNGAILLPHKAARQPGRENPEDTSCDLALRGNGHDRRLDC